MGAMPFQLSTSGSVQATPASIADPALLLAQSIDLGSTETYDACFGANLPIAGTFIPALGAVSKIRFVAVRAVDGESLVASVTWANGTNQLIPVSDVLLLKAKNPGDEITAIQLSGIGRIEYIIAGNKA
jgi:hypothetical protein